MIKKLIILFIGPPLLLIFGVLFIPKTKPEKIESDNMVVYMAGECFTFDQNFTFCIPVNSYQTDSLMNASMARNDYIRFVVFLIDDRFSESAGIVLSSFSNDSAIPLDSAFHTHLVKRAEVDTVQDYELISSEVYEKNGIDFYRKITRRYGDLYSVVHYFMENDYSNVVYEIKTGGRLIDLEKLKTLAEEIAISAYFKNEDQTKGVPRGPNTAHFYRKHAPMVAQNL